MYDTGKINPATGKRILSARRPSMQSLYQYPEVLVPCGKCSACLESRRFDWCLRLMLEQKVSPSATFITLTYDNAHLPKDNKADKSHIQLFLKRLRNSVRDFGVRFDSSLRYFIASEHGTLNGRVHYHGIIFGVDMFQKEWKTLHHHFDRDGHPVFVSPVLEKIWSNGFTSVGRVTRDSIKYISDYIYGDSECRLFSIGLGVPFFCVYGSVNGRLVPVDILPSARQAAELGFITVGSLDRIRKVPPPKFLLRYLEKFSPSHFERFKALRVSLARDRSFQSIAPHLVEEHTETTKQEKLRKKKL